MSIETDSTPLEEPKNPDTCNVFNIYKSVADSSQIGQMKQNYLAGGYGFGHAKTELYELLLKNFENERELYTELIQDEELLNKFRSLSEKYLDVEHARELENAIWSIEDMTDVNQLVELLERPCKGDLEVVT